MVSRADSIKSEKQQAKAGMNLFLILKDYIDSMLSEQQGRKAFILDEETLGKFCSPNLLSAAIVSMVYSRTQILQKEVFFFELINNIPSEKLTHLKAIVFVRCTDENVKLICQHLHKPTFLSYNLCK